MVMRRNMMRRNLRRSIMHSLGRYVAIAVIIALGAAIFVGLRSTKMDMVATGQVYMDAQNMFDLRLISSYGWNRDQLPAIAAMDGIEEAEGVFYSDLIVQKSDGDDAEVYRFYTIPESINKLALLEGRMPESADECLADGFRNGASVIGKTVTIAQDNSLSALDQLTVRTFTIVGLVSTPLYMDMNRGNTSVGSGSIANYYFVPEAAFDVNYYTEIHVRIPGDHTVYSDAFQEAMTQAADPLKALLEPLAQARLISARSEAEKAYSDGKKDYEDAVLTYQTEKEDALQKLADAKKTLEDGELELADGEKKLQEAEQEIADGWAQIADKRAELANAEKALESGQSGGEWQLNNAKAELMARQAELEANAQELEAGLLQINAGLLEVQSGISQIRAGLVTLDAAMSPIDALMRVADLNITVSEQTIQNMEAIGTPEAMLQEARRLLEETRTRRAGYEARLAELRQQKEELSAQLASLLQTQTELETKRDELIAAREQIRQGRQTILAAYEEINTQRTNMGNQLISARQQYLNGLNQIQDAEKQLRASERELAEARATLERNKADLEQGWIDYWAAEEEAQQKFAEAEAELADAEKKLEDARIAIADITRTDVYVLDRGSNIGYGSLNSSSDIVAGVARVFPAFFLLVAALVCITTMTRMVDEERTQIGTMKALGYSSAAIISKYLLYAGSSAILGCTLGVGLGSVIFPTVLWQAYKIMLFVTPMIELRFDWQMAAGVTVLYTAAMLLVTWYCCHKSLREVPAELIRPKAPTSGKALFVEKLPLWRHLSFLNKVAIRNIFRYRQRLAMMLLGIGGCTALLMTGFGIRDSISKIVDIQFRDVMFFDMEVYFRSGRTAEEQAEFRAELENYASGVHFFHQVSGEIEANSQTRDIYIMASDEDITRYMDFHNGTEPLPMPGVNEVLLSAGMAEILNIQPGDTVTLRNPDLEALQLTVSGIYENHVYNYALVTPETIRAQWGREPEMQMAFVSVREGRNPNSAGAAANRLNGVINVTVSQELAKSVNTMMAAMDLVVIVVVFCAGVLAVIVLYNLTNININERIREIATIKVLGFNAMETAMYVFKENLVLSVFGTAFGIPMGKFLLEFVISQIKIDLIWIKPTLAGWSLAVSIVLTILSAVAVDSIFYFKLEKINMAEALKSVE